MHVHFNFSGHNDRRSRIKAVGSVALNGQRLYRDALAKYQIREVAAMELRRRRRTSGTRLWLDGFYNQRRKHQALDYSTPWSLYSPPKQMAA